MRYPFSIYFSKWAYINAYWLIFTDMDIDERHERIMKYPAKDREKYVKWLYPKPKEQYRRQWLRSQLNLPDPAIL